MRRLLAGSILAVAVCLAVGVAVPPVLAAPPERTHFEGVIPADQGCGTEAIRISGTVLFRITDGPEPSMRHVVYQGVSGVGLRTGTRYSLSFMNHSLSVFREPGEELVFHDVGSFIIVSRGPAPNYREKGYFHSITRPDGSDKFIHKFEATCR
jgi:hypothetical protein